MSIIDSHNYSESDAYALQPIIWSESFSVGEENLDDDHRCLIAQLNAIYLAIRENFGEEIVRDLMRQLADDQMDHFHNEVAVLRRYEYPLTDDHAARHHVVMAELDTLRERATEITLSELTRIAMAAKALMLKHLIGDDGRFKSFLQARIEMAAR